MTPAPAGPGPDQPIQVAPNAGPVGALAGTPGPQELPVPAWERFAAGLPKEMPDTAYDALREQFFHERVAPDVLSHGMALAPARHDFMSKTGRGDIAFPRLAMIAGSAGETFGEPLDEGGLTQASRHLKERGEEAAAHQGIHPGPYEFLGSNLGMVPYYGPAIAAGEVLGGVAGVTKAAQALINSGAGALVQGAYDAATAPTGGRVMAGAKGALAGAATIGGFELLHNSGALMKFIKGVASESEAKEAVEQILSDPDLEKKVTAEIQQKEAAAKQGGMPRETPIGRSNGTATATVKATDGQVYGVQDPVAQVPNIAAHLQQGASIEQIGGDPTAIEKVQLAVEKEQAKTGAFDTPAGPSDVTGPLQLEPDIPLDEIRKYVAGQTFVTPQMLSRQFKLGYDNALDALNEMKQHLEVSMGQNNKFYWMGPEDEETEAAAKMARSVRPTDLRKSEPEWNWQDHPASTSLARSAYDEDTQRLRIEFRSGHQYDYSNIPPGLRQEMLDADSVGKFFAQRIKPLDRTFDARQVSAPSGIPEAPAPQDDLAQRLQDSIDVAKAKYTARVRGSVPKGLDGLGMHEAAILGMQSEIKGGFDELHGANTPRHQQTVAAIESYNPMAIRHPPNPNLDPRGWGQMEGMPQNMVRSAMDDYMRKMPYERPYGVSPYSGKPGESTIDVAHRLLPELGGMAERAGREGKKIGAVVSSSDIALAAGRAKAIRESNPAGIDFDEVADMHEDPGAVFSWDGAGDFRPVDMYSPEEFENKLHLIRHGHTDWNEPEELGEPEPESDYERLTRETQEYGATHKETPLVHRHVGDIPFLEGTEGMEITGHPGDKPSVFYPSNPKRSAIFEENFHAGVDYMNLENELNQILWSEKHGDMTGDLWHNYAEPLYPGLLDRWKGEETFIKAAKAVRTGDADMLEDLARADTDMPHLLEWTTDVTNELLNRVAQRPPSLHKSAMERRMGSVVSRSTRSLDEMNVPYAGGAAALDYDNGRWAVNTAGKTLYFDTREDALEHLEDNYAIPLNTPELVDYSKLPDNVARFARDERPPNIRRPPITSDPPPPKEQPPAGGLFILSRYFRPFYDWVADASQRLGRPDLYDAFSKFDDGVVAMNNFQRPYTKVLEETLEKVSRKDQSRFFKLAQALPADRAQVAKDLAFTPKEMDIFREFNDKFGNPLESEFGVPLDTFIRQMMPRWQRGGVDTQFPHYPDVGQQKAFGDFDEALKVGEISPHDQNLLRVAINYMRVGARRQYLGDAINEAAKLVDEKNPDGSYKLGLIRTSLARHIEYMRGTPDHTAAVMESVATSVINKLNEGITMANKALPDNLQIPSIDIPPREAYNKLILFMYAGELAMRPALLIRDGVQFFLTTLPILGRYAWTGISKAVELGKEAWDEPQRRGVLIEKKDLQNLYSAGGDEKDAGMFERFAEKAMSWIQFSHNSNRMVAFWGHAAKAEDALHDFYAGKLDTKGLADESGMWFMKEAMRKKYTQEAQILDARLPDFDAHVGDLSRRIAKDMVELTQWNFKRGANPGIYEYQLGRLLGQYGTWPLNYIEYARRYFTSGSSPEAVKAGVRLALIHGAAQAAGAAAGVDISNWLWTGPMAYGGGPALEALTNIPQSMDFETQRGAEARHELRKAFFPGLIPGGEAAATIWEAATSDDPDFWIKTMGFTPIDKRTELRK